MENLKRPQRWGSAGDTEYSVMRQEDNGKSWYVRVEDVVMNRFEVPADDSGEWYEPETTIVDLT